MKILILGKPGTWYTTALQDAFEARGARADCMPITRLRASVGTPVGLSIEESPLETYDAAVVRAIPGGSLEQIIFRMDALHRLEKSGVRFFNPPASIEQGVDKYHTLALMADAGLPVPETVVTERFDEALAAFDELGGDVVVKPLFGAEGRGMVRVTDRDTAYRVFRALEMSRYVFYLQAFVPHGRVDIRVFTVGGRAVAAMKRRGEGWKANIANGASGEALALDDELSDMGVRAAHAVGAVYAGVDILPLDGGGYEVIEVNTIPGWRGLQRATGFDGAGCLADFVLEGGVGP